MRFSIIVRVVAWLLVLAFVLPPQLHAQIVSDPRIWHTFVSRLEPGKRLQVRLKNGQHFKASLLDVSDESMTLQPRTRTAVPPQRVRFAEVETLELDNSKGSNLVKAVALGAAVGAGAFFGLLTIALAAWSD